MALGAPPGPLGPGSPESPAPGPSPPPSCHARRGVRCLGDRKTRGGATRGPSLSPGSRRLSHVCAVRAGLCLLSEDPRKPVTRCPGPVTTALTGGRRRLALLPEASESSRGFGPVPATPSPSHASEKRPGSCGSPACRPTRRLHCGPGELLATPPPVTTARSGPAEGPRREEWDGGHQGRERTNPSRGTRWGAGRHPVCSPHPGALTLGALVGTCQVAETPASTLLCPGSWAAGQDPQRLRGRNTALGPAGRLLTSEQGRSAGAAGRPPAGRTGGRGHGPHRGPSPAPWLGCRGSRF